MTDAVQLAIIASIPALLAALSSFRNGRVVDKTKAAVDETKAQNETLIEKSDEIHHLTDGNMTAMREALSVANAKIEAANAKIEMMHQQILLMHRPGDDAKAGPVEVIAPEGKPLQVTTKDTA